MLMLLMFGRCMFSSISGGCSLVILFRVFWFVVVLVIWKFVCLSVWCLVYLVIFVLLMLRMRGVVMVLGFCWGCGWLSGIVGLVFCGRCCVW